MGSHNARILVGLAIDPEGRQSSGDYAFRRWQRPASYFGDLLVCFAFADEPQDLNLNSRQVTEWAIVV
jgi:hypothetical protein